MPAHAIPEVATAAITYHWFNITFLDISFISFASVRTTRVHIKRHLALLYSYHRRRRCYVASNLRAAHYLNESGSVHFVPASPILWTYFNNNKIIEIKYGWVESFHPTRRSAAATHYFSNHKQTNACCTLILIVVNIKFSTTSLKSHCENSYLASSFCLWVTERPSRYTLYHLEREKENVVKRRIDA